MRLMFPWEPPKIIKGVSDVEYLKGKYPDKVWLDYEFARTLMTPVATRKRAERIAIIHNEHN